MPMITVRYVTPSPRPELKADVARLASKLGAERLGKDPNVTAVLVEEAAAKLEVRDAQGQTPLFVAADCGHQSAALYLIARGADPQVWVPGLCHEVQ